MAFFIAPLIAAGARLAAPLAIRASAQIAKKLVTYFDTKVNLPGLAVAGIGGGLAYKAHQDNRTDAASRHQAELAQRELHHREMLAALKEGRRETQDGFTELSATFRHGTRETMGELRGLRHSFGRVDQSMSRVETGIGRIDRRLAGAENMCLNPQPAFDYNWR